MSTPVPNLELLEYQKIWELLEASTEWKGLFPEQNRIRYDTVEGIQNPQPSNTADDSYPQARLWLSSGNSQLRTSDETFGTHSSEGVANWLERTETIYTLEMKSQLLKFGEVTSMGAESRAAIRAGGARLGLAHVIGVTMGWEVKEIDRNDAEQTMRWECRLRIVLKSEYNGATLLPVNT